MGRLASIPAPTGTVSLVFTDVQDSTALWDKCQTSMDASLTMHNDHMRDLLEHCRGCVEREREGEEHVFLIIGFSSSAPSSPRQISCLPTHLLRLLMTNCFFFFLSFFFSIFILPALVCSASTGTK